MADTKITALTALTAADPASDVLPIVDISDTTMAASGTTKKISINNILAASGTATLASATITGDLTVDTSTLKVDSANNRVGIGTASPYSTGESLNARTTALTSIAAFQSMPLTVTDSTAYAVGVGGGINFRAKLDPSSYSNYAAIWSYRESATNSDYRGSLVFGTTDNSNGYPIERYRIASDGVATWSNVGGIGGTAMTLNATGLGVGVVPSAGKGALQLSSGINFPATQVASSDANTLDDYEEGTFTPTVVGSSTVGSATYATQIGRYVKIGRQVTAWVHLEWSGGTGTGNLRFGGLPFNIVTLGSNNFPSASIGYISNIALSANNIAVAYGQNAENNVNLGQYPVGGGTGASVAYDTAGQIIFTITYEV
jgi:hypothetical protein